LLDKFRSVQEKSRRAQRSGNEFDDGFMFTESNQDPGLDSKAFKDLIRLPGPPAAAKEAVVPPPPVAKAKTGLGKFGRLGGGGKAKK
jgi:vacuole morphology and inheritance protein 14